MLKIKMYFFSLLEVKGSYEQLAAIAVPHSIPKDYVAVTEEHAKQQFYVLAAGSVGKLNLGKYF